MNRNRIAWALAALAVLGTSAPALDLRIAIEEPPEGLLAVMQTASLLFALEDQGNASPLDLVAAAQADYQRMLTGLYAEGYYGGSVSILLDGREATTIAPLEAPASIRDIVIRIEPGPRFSFGLAEIGPLAPGTVLPAEFSTGQVARSGTVRDAALAAVEAWRAAGHAKAEPASQSITARHSQAVLDASVGVNPGPLLTFGPLSVTGNSAVRSERILVIAGLPEGRSYSPAELERAARRLRLTGAFGSVTMIEAEEVGPGDTLAVTAQLTEQLPRRIGGGIELSSTEGLALSGYWMHRNLLGGAEKFRADASVAGLGGSTGGIDYGLDLSFARPGFKSAYNTLLADLSLGSDEEPDYSLQQADGSIRISRQFGDDWSANAGLGLLVAQEDNDFGERSYALVTLPIAGSIDRRDDPLNARSGYYLDLDLLPFAGLSGIDSGARIYGDGRFYRSFGAERRFTIAARGQIGSVIGADILDAPADFLFHSGGGGTVRGQPYHDLGVDVTEGLVTARHGGLSFVGAQLEARLDVTPAIGLVGFYDIGYVGADSRPGTAGDWHSGTGLGLRYNTGIGPIRLDLATPASGADAFGSLQVYVGIGQAF